MPTKSELISFERRLAEARNLPEYIVQALNSLPKDAHPMDVLQACIPLLAMSDPDLHHEDKESHYRMAVRLIARIPVIVAAWNRIRNGQSFVEPDKTLTHAENFLFMLHGKVPSKTMADALDTCLALHADHTFNASTFACREVVSTRAHMYAGVAAGIGALSGALHGGANAQVMKMLLELKGKKDVSSWVKERLNRGEKIMGMGHAVYKTMDPRAKFLKEMGARLAAETGNQELYNISLIVKKTAMDEFEKRGKTDIKPNVDFYSAPVYYMMGIPLDVMTPIFAMSRIVGWCAHIIEEKFAEAQEKPALYRPKAEYVGEYCGLMGCTYIPPEQRGH